MLRYEMDLVPQMHIVADLNSEKDNVQRNYCTALRGYLEITVCLELRQLEVVCPRGLQLLEISYSLFEIFAEISNLS